MRGALRGQGVLTKQNKKMQAKKASVLAVGFDAAFMRHVRKILPSDRFLRVEHEGDAQRALEKLAQKSRDIVLVNWDIQGLKGGRSARVALCRKFRKACVEASLVIIADTVAQAVKAEGAFVDAQFYMTPERLSAPLFFRLLRERDAVLDLKREQAFNESVFSATGAMIMVSDLYGRIVRINASFENVMEYPAQEVIGTRPWDIFVSGEAGRKGRSFFKEVREEKRHKPLKCETVWTTKSGKQKTIAWVCKPAKIGFGENYTHIISSGMDVTEARLSEQALHDSEALFSSMFHSSPSLNALTTPVGGVHLDVNKAWLKTLGFKRQDVIGRSAAELGVWANLADRRRFIGAMMRNKGSIRGFEAKFRTQSGKYLDFLISSELLDVGGEQRLLFVGNDVTHMKEVEEALRASHGELEKRVAERTEALAKSEQRWRDMIEADSDWLWETDANERFTYFSESFEKILKSPADLSLGKQRSRVRDESFAPESWAKYEKAVKQRKPFRDVVYLHTKLQHYFRISGKPVFENNVFVGYRGTASDITKEVTAERNAQRAQEMLSDAIENIADGFVLFDKDDQFVLCNAKYKDFFPEIAKHLKVGATFEEILRKGKLFNRQDKLDDGERDALLQARLDRHRNPGVPFTRRMGEEEWIRISERHTSNGGTVGIVSDISELILSGQQLLEAKHDAERASQAKSNFLANMSHELRTPLNAIIGFSDMMKSEVFGAIDNENYRSYVGNIHASGSHLLDLINDVLDVSRIEAGAMRLIESDIDIAHLVSECIKYISQRARESDVKLKTHIAKDLPKLLGDEIRIKQILINLLTNAVKFTGANGTITCQVTMDKLGRMCLVVRDQGIGMSDEEIDVALAPFGQVENAYTRTREGTGLGLPLVMRLAQLHDAEFEINSTRNKGTEVSVLFPAKRVVS